MGKKVQIVRTNPGTGAQTTETATVQSVKEGEILRIAGPIEEQSDDGVPTRVIFNSIPENLRATPTLSVTVDAAGAGPREATLSYLTTGLSWKADYVALFDEKQGSLRFQGWVTMTNKSGTSYKDARTQLIAGEINLTDGGQDYSQRRAAGNGTAPSQNAIADYHLYTLPERVTVADNQTKQVGFLDLQGVRAAKAYGFHANGFHSDDGPEHADVTLKFASGAQALPAGVVRVYMRDVDGAPKFVGEDDIGHTPAGSDLFVKTGEAFDVTVQPTLVSSEKISAVETRYAMSYDIRNAQSVPVMVDLRQEGLRRGGTVETESLNSTRIDAGTLGWSAAVPANGETVLTFTVDQGT